MRKLLLIACLLMVTVATPVMAQEPPDGVAAQLAQTAAPPAIVPTPAGAMNIFTAIFTAIDTPLMAAVNGIVVNTAQQAHVWLIAGGTLYLAIWAASMAFAPGSAGSFFFGAMVKELINVAIAIAVIDVYALYVVPFALTDFPGELSHLFIASGQPQVGVGVAGSFDTVWSTVRSLGFVIQGRLPDSWVPSVIMLMAAMVIFKAVGFVMVLWAFGVYMSVHLLAVVVVAIGPIMIALAAVPTTRRYAWGWLGVVLWSIASIAMVSLVLGIAIAVITQECQVLGALDQNVSIYDQVDGFLGVCGCLFLLACVVTAQPWVAHSIFGGAASAMGGVGAGGAAVGGYVAAAGRRITGAI
jgi:hypothetical protein